MNWARNFRRKKTRWRNSRLQWISIKEQASILWEDACQCLQFPILFAMFRFFPVSIELRQEHFLTDSRRATLHSILTQLGWHLYMEVMSVCLPFNDCLLPSDNENVRIINKRQDQPGMKMMMYMMPVMFILILNQWSSGLTYYYFLANMLTWIQNVISKRLLTLKSSSCAWGE